MSSSLWENAARVAAAETDLLTKLKGSRILVTGSTGLIGSQLVRVLLSANDSLGLGLSLVLPVRNIEKAERFFGSRDCIELFGWSMGGRLKVDGELDYVCHAASSTSSADFLNRPVEVMGDTLDAGRVILGLSRVADVKKSVLLSTMEVFGETDGKVSESDLGRLDSSSVRNSYPIAKKALECLYCSYASEYGGKNVVLRLAQSFGAGVSVDDGRVFADFGRHAIAGDDIVMLSDGQKRNPYVSVDDVVRAILYAFVEGEPGEIYNVANEDAYCSILEMAEMVVSQFGAADAAVRRAFDPEREKAFRKAADLEMDCSKLHALGWRPVDSLEDMYRSMFKAWEEVRNV